MNDIGGNLRYAHKLVVTFFASGPSQSIFSIFFGETLIITVLKSIAPLLFGHHIAQID